MTWSLMSYTSLSGVLSGESCMLIVVVPWLICEFPILVLVEL